MGIMIPISADFFVPYPYVIAVDSNGNESLLRCSSPNRNLEEVSDFSYGHLVVVSADGVGGGNVYLSRYGYWKIYGTATMPRVQSWLILSEYVKQEALQEGLATKQDKLISGTNVKTINGESVLGSGDINTTPTLDEVLKKDNTSEEVAKIGGLEVVHEDSGNSSELYAAGLNLEYNYEGQENRRMGHIDYESVGFSHLERNTSPSGGYNIVQDFVVSAKNGQVEMNEAIKGAFREKLGITKEVFIAKQGTTSAAELIAAYEANQAILIVPSGTVYTSWRWVAIGLDRKSATKCEVIAIFNNGSNLNNGLAIVKFTVDGTTWTYASQLVQNKLVSGTNIKTINNQSVLGEGNLDIQLPTITGSNWGVASVGIGRVPASSSGGASVDVDVSDLNLSSSDDYEVTVLGMDDSVYKLSKKTATNFTIVRVNPSASGLMNTVFHYIIAAKGYGSTPKGGTTGQVLAKKSDDDGDVEWRDSVGGGAEFSIDEASNTGTLGQGNDYFGVDMSNDDSVDLSLTKPGEYAKNKTIPTKEYVDGKVSQVATMLTADANSEGKIYQYVGATDANYTNGYFYQCEEITPSTNPKTYQWVQKNVQTGGGGEVNVIETVKVNGTALVPDDDKAVDVPVPDFHTLNASAHIEQTKNNNLHRLSVDLEDNTNKIAVSIWNGLSERRWHAETEQSLRKDALNGTTPDFSLQNGVGIIMMGDFDPLSLSYVVMDDNDSWTGVRVTDTSPFIFNRKGTSTELMRLTATEDNPGEWSISVSDGTLDNKMWNFFTKNPVVPRVQSWLDLSEYAKNEDVNTELENKQNRLTYNGNLTYTAGNVKASGSSSGVDAILPDVAYIGELSSLTTTDKSNIVAALNEVYEKSGEPFRVKQWASSFNVTIPTCTSDISNTSIAKMTFTIDDVEGADYQIVGMIAYEVFDAVSGGNRINCWPVCQFTGNGQKELSVRWMCGGTTDKVARRINAWVLLKHR